MISCHSSCYIHVHGYYWLVWRMGKHYICHFFSIIAIWLNLSSSTIHNLSTKTLHSWCFWCWDGVPAIRMVYLILPMKNISCSQEYVDKFWINSIQFFFAFPVESINWKVWHCYSVESTGSGKWVFGGGVSMCGVIHWWMYCYTALVWSTLDSQSAWLVLSIPADKDTVSGNT